MSVIVLKCVSVDLPTIVPFYFTRSIWTGPGVAAVKLNRDDTPIYAYECLRAAAYSCSGCHTS